MASEADKKSPYYIKGKCYNDCEVTMTVGEEKAELYVCKDYLAKLSEYFRIMFFGNFKEKDEKLFEITDETSDDIICFFNAIDPDPDVRKIAVDSVELLMRLSDKFQCDLLKKYLKNHIEVNGPNCDPSTTLNWLYWCLQYNMHEEMIKICLNMLKICDDSIEFLMSLANEYQCDLLKKCLKNHIEINGPNCDPSTTLNWLSWCLQYNMHEEMVKICLNLLKICHDSIGFLMSLANEYQCDLLKKCLKNHIEINGPNCDPLTTLNWLSWSLQYNMPEEMVKICLNKLKICDDSIQFLMSLAGKYHCDLLKKCLKQYIQTNEPNCQSGSVILNWLLWSLQYHMPEQLVKLCLPGVASLSMSTLHANGEKIGWKLVAKMLDVKMRLIFKANELINKNIIPSTIDCYLCHSPIPKNRFPFRVQWCTANESMAYLRCWACSKKDYSHYCDKCQFYYKCSLCELDLSSYKNEDNDQCLCVRKNYEIML